MTLHHQLHDRTGRLENSFSCKSKNILTSRPHRSLRKLQQV
ncbi:hypothetical protein AO369_0292 [Moraxella catarrhalis]|nr:hypothetical protein AO369_0292 [Moraxella catarrhalis]